MSILAWITFALCAVLVAVHYATVGDARFLAYAIPGVALLAVIPVVLNRMSRKSFDEAHEIHGSRARLSPIKNVTSDRAGDAVRVRGIVKKISFRWLRRPHYIIEEGEHRLRVIVFTMPREDIKVGDSVEATGLVMKHLLSRKKEAVLSAIRVTTVSPK